MGYYINFQKQNTPDEKLKLEEQSSPVSVQIQKNKVQIKTEQARKENRPLYSKEFNLNLIKKLKPITKATKKEIKLSSELDWFVKKRVSYYTSGLKKDEISNELQLIQNPDFD